MGTYARTKYWWKKYEKNPATGLPWHAPASTKIPVDAATKEQRQQNHDDADAQFCQDMIDLRAGRPIAAEREQAAALAIASPLATYRAYITGVYREKYTANNRGHRNETSALNAFVKEFGDLALDDFTTERIEAYMKERRRTVKNSTLKRQIGLLKTSLRRWAVALKKAGCSAPHARDILSDLVIGRVEEVEVRWFSEAEFDRFIAAVESRESILGTPRTEGLLLAYTAVETCLRRGSLMKLRWHHVRPTHLVPLNAKQEIKRSPITPNMRQYLDVLDNSSGPLFASHDRAYIRAKQRGFIMTEGQRHQSMLAHVDRWFREVCALAGLPYGRAEHGVTFHSFRHTGATWLLNGSATRRPVSVKTVMELGGWKNVRVFIKTYCHTDAASVDAAAASLFADRVHTPRLVASHNKE